MKKIYILLLFIAFNLVFAQKNDFKKSIDSLINYLQTNDAFSGTILLQKKDEVIYKGEFNKFQSASDKYRIGSISKVFTAIITFQLIEEGKLNLNTKLDQFYPNIKNADKITIANLLNHTSGIYNYLDWEDYYISKKNNFSKNDMLKLIEMGKPQFKPGSDSYYSNSNYLLLGYIIESITLKSYPENVKIRITDKIGLTNTFCETSDKEYMKRNTSYKFNGEKWAKEQDTHPSFTFSAGAIVSTAEDLSKLMQELFKGTLVTENSLKQMQNTYVVNGIGYGLFKAPFYEKTGYGHSGRIDEFHSFAGYFPDDNLSIVILSNGTNIKLNEVVLGVLSKYYDKKYKYPNFSKYESKTAQPTTNYIGVYKAQLAGLITLGTFQITQAGKNHLFLSMYNNGKDSEKVLLERKGENSFYAFENGANLLFLLDKKGKVDGIEMKQGKQSVKCKKIK